MMMPTDEPRASRDVNFLRMEAEPGVAYTTPIAIAQEVGTSQLPASRRTSLGRWDRRKTILAELYRMIPSQWPIIPVSYNPARKRMMERTIDTISDQNTAFL